MHAEYISDAMENHTPIYLKNENLLHTQMS